MEAMLRADLTMGDMGELPEAEMVRRWYPGGKQPITAAPILVPLCDADPGRDHGQRSGRVADVPNDAIRPVGTGLRERQLPHRQRAVRKVEATDQVQVALHSGRAP